MTIVVELNRSQLQQIVDENEERGRGIANAARADAVPRDAFVFFAAFDGTNNDKDNLAGDRFSTNVGQLWDQHRVANAPRLRGGYYPGLGTKGKSTKETWLGAAVTAGVITTGRKAFEDFTLQASDWLQDHPSGAVTVVVTGFSRGTASAAIFAQLLCQKGLVSQGQILIPPGEVRISAGVLFDPVATGVAGNLAFPPIADNVVVIRAINEYRQLFRAVDYREQKELTSLTLYGNHCDVGGGYDNGLAALSLDAATKFLQKSGLPIPDVPAARRFRRNDVAIHSEQKDEHGNEIWSVYNDTGFSFADSRLFDKAIRVKGASNGPGPREFVMFDDSRISL